MDFQKLCTLAVYFEPRWKYTDLETVDLNSFRNWRSVGLTTTSYCEYNHVGPTPTGSWCRQISFEYCNWYE